MGCLLSFLKLKQQKPINTEKKQQSDRNKIINEIIMQDGNQNNVYVNKIENNLQK